MKQALPKPRTIPLRPEVLKRVLLLTLGVALAAMTLYMWWAGYAPMFTTYADPAATARMVEPAEWFVTLAPDLTTLVPILEDGALPLPALRLL